MTYQKLNHAGILALVCVTLFANSAIAAENPPTTSSVSAVGVSGELRDLVVLSLERSFPSLVILAVVKTPMPSIVALELDGGQIVYASANGDFLLAGDMYQLQPKVINLAQARRSERRMARMNQVPTAEMIIFSPTGETKSHINVFTDVDCGYCRKLHLEVPALNARGIEVRYLAFPRSGLDTPTYEKIVSAWCAKDPNAALTALKAGRSIPTKQCDNPVADQYALGQRVGVTGTPAIVTATGKLLPGYMPAADLAETLGL